MLAHFADLHKRTPASTSQPPLRHLENVLGEGPRGFESPILRRVRGL